MPITPTVKEVAKLAGVSPGTVTRFLQAKSLKEDTRRRVQAAIERLGYRVNAAARTLRSRKSSTIGVLVEHIFPSSGSPTVEAMEGYFLKRGYGLAICVSGGDPAVEREKVLFLVDKQIDGLVLFPTAGTSRNLDLFHSVQSKGIGIVTVGSSVDGLECDCVMFNNAVATYEACELLIDQGHKRIGVMAGPSGYAVAGERLSGYQEALSHFHLPMSTELIWQSDYSERSGWEGTMRFLDLPNPPSAILATNYSLTVGSLLALNERGIRIPQGMSFIGFEILELSRVVVPRLHVIATPLEELGLTASALLYERIMDLRSGPPTVVRLDTQLLKGESVVSHA